MTTDVSRTITVIMSNEVPLPIIIHKGAIQFSVLNVNIGGLAPYCCIFTLLLPVSIRKKAKFVSI